MKIGEYFIGRFACNCMKVTVANIKEAIADGAASHKEVHQKTLYGAKCGACIKPIDMIIDEELKQRRSETE